MSSLVFRIEVNLRDTSPGRSQRGDGGLYAHRNYRFRPSRVILMAFFVSTDATSPKALKTVRFKARDPPQ